MAEYINREALLERIDGIWDCADMVFEPNDKCCRADDCASCKWRETKNAIRKIAAYLPAAFEDAQIGALPAADAREVPSGGIGEMSDGYHTFNGLYYQRMVLFSALVNAYQDRAWKSWKHEDGELCFGGGWFIVGIDTPQGSYTYHYEDKYWNWFECEELPVARHWDGHTEEDVTRLLSLPDVRPVVLCKDCKHRFMTPNGWRCPYAEWGIEDDDFCSCGEKREES